MYRRSSTEGRRSSTAPRTGEEKGLPSGSQRILWEACGVRGRGQRQIPHSSDGSQQPTSLPATRSRALCGQPSAPDIEPDTWLSARNTQVSARFCQGLLPSRKADFVAGCTTLPLASSDVSSQYVQAPQTFTVGGGRRNVVDRRLVSRARMRTEKEKEKERARWSWRCVSYV